MKKISAEEFVEFANSLRGQNPVLRVGQLFCNTHSITDPTLFYETDRKKAFDHIAANYVEG